MRRTVPWGAVLALAAAVSVLLALGGADVAVRRSSLHRAILTRNPVAYWPLFDFVSRDNPGPSHVAGVNSLGLVINSGTDYGVRPGELAPWLDTGLEFSGHTSAGVISIRTTVNLGVEPTALALDFVQRGHGGTGAITQFAFANTSTHTGGQSSYILGSLWDATTPELRLVHTSPTTTLDSDTSSLAFAPWDDRPHHWRLLLEQDGSDIDVTAYLDGVAVLSGTHASATLQSPTVAFDISATPLVAIGHMVLWVDDIPDVGDLAEAALGHRGEFAHDRFDRLTSEESVPAYTMATHSQPVGPQPVANLVDLLVECETADYGTLSEARDGRLWFRSNAERYNQDPALELDYDAGHVGQPLATTDDDLHIINDLTVSRFGGGSYRATDEESIAAVGRYESSIAANLAEDGFLPAFAQWGVHLSSHDDSLRFTDLRLNLHRTTDLIDQWCSTDLGDRVSLSNLPETVTYDDADLILDGYQEQISSFEWTATLNCSPGSVYRVAEIGRDGYDILGSDSATIAEDLDATETEVDVNCGAGPDWDHEVDFDIFVGGERMTVTAVAAMAGTFPNRTCTLTVVRSVNGVVKSHSSGAAITMASPVYIGL